MKNPSKLAWQNISKAPTTSGVYAWYYVPEITTYDINSTTSKIKLLVSEGRRDEAFKVVEDVLQSRIYQYFRHDPYEVSLSGQLMPKYKGKVFHDQYVSDSLINRLLDNPEKFQHIREVLERSAPHFASPMYIGMADSLVVRLKHHKSLIEKFRGARLNQTIASNSAEQDNDTVFAQRVVTRNIPPERLFVVIFETPDIQGLEVDIEHIFNRIYFPILGRN